MDFKVLFILNHFKIGRFPYIKTERERDCNRNVKKLIHFIRYSMKDIVFQLKICNFVDKTGRYDKRDIH